MNILYIGDIMGRAGVEVVAKILPDLRRKESIDFVVAQSENVTHAKGMSPKDMDALRELGVDFFSGGNHSIDQEELFPRLLDDQSPVIGPANMPNCPGKGWKYADTRYGKVLVISLLGSIVGKDALNPVINPLQKIDEILAANKGVERVATVLNFHGDYSSEKIVIGQYLDGKVSVVIGDHWHVPTADARVLAGGTAHITDVGMCGALNSSLGVKTQNIIERWRDGVTNRNLLETTGPRQFNAVLVQVDTASRKSLSIKHLQHIID